jgi:hypothetical protein
LFAEMINYNVCGDDQHKVCGSMWLNRILS